MSQNDSDITSIIEKTAHFVSKHGLVIEEKILPLDTSYSFLKSSDPLHGIYKQKLTEYQNGAAHDDDDDDDSTDSDYQVADTEIIYPPPGVITTLIEETARFVSKKGYKAKKMLMESNADCPIYNFLKRCDPYHAFYKHKVIEYRPQEDATDSSDDDDLEEVASGDAQPIFKSQSIALPRLLLFCIPIGMTLKEFNTIKLTAQFVAWYGGAFWLGLVNRAIPQFEFLKPASRWFSCFTKLATEYSKELMPPTDLKQELINSAPYTATIIDAFLQRLQWSPLQHHQWLEGGKSAMVDWHASVTKDLANKDQNQELPPPPLEEPNPKSH